MVEQERERHLGNLRLRGFSGGTLLGRGEKVDKNEKITKDGYPSLISVTEISFRPGESDRWTAETALRLLFYKKARCFSEKHRRLYSSAEEFCGQQPLPTSHQRFTNVFQSPSQIGFCFKHSGICVRHFSFYSKIRNWLQLRTVYDFNFDPPFVRGIS